ncbi:MAG: hypothetical protein RR191_04780 [Cetobacterium sp.]|uniref:hypothetical protein n=1 Tax=unclassified Cetobacterium TaxID=2630983 RepID=UPI00163C7225|nr:hypothetical protein [Cetobacterium sp. 2A]MBC2856889.1 hypothetical protein [Cetobacterium sp. 2A]
MKKIELIEKYFSSNAIIKIKNTEKNKFIELKNSTENLKSVIEKKVEFWMKENNGNIIRRAFFSQTLNNITDEKMIEILFLDGNIKYSENIFFKKTLFGEEVDSFFKAMLLVKEVPIFLFENNGKVYLDNCDTELECVNLETNFPYVEIITK